MPTLPSGAVTIVFTDIVASSRQWEDDSGRMRDALAAHDSMINEVVESFGGTVFKHTGDGASCAFSEPADAVEAAIVIQSRLEDDAWDHGARLQVRIGIHTGDVEPTGGDYFGPVPNRAARIMALANGGQITCSSATADGIAASLTRAEGRHELRGIGAVEVFTIIDGRLSDNQNPLRFPVNKSNLPRRFTSFLGRDSDVTTTADLIRRRRGLTTLVGPGGVGKTRLAIEVGETLQRDFTGGVHFCDLTAVSDAEAVADSVAEVIGARLQPGMDIVASIVDYLDNHDILLIIDNCEHVLEAARGLVIAILRLDGASVLATSRESLGVPGEQLAQVAPLDTDGGGIELFVDRARDRDPGFTLDRATHAVVQQIVTDLGGVPLAIELAAAWARVMAPAEILERLRDHLQILDGGDKLGPARTIRETVKWSMELLDHDEAILLTRLSAFIGGFDLRAAEQVCSDAAAIPAGDVPRIVMSLVDKSMLQVNTSGPLSRFTMLETIRNFAAILLAESDPESEIQVRHAHHYLELSGKQNKLLFSAAEADAWTTLDAEWGNIRKALDTFEKGKQIENGIDLVLALAWFATISMRFELFGWVDELLAADGISDHPAYTDLCGAAALGLYFTVDDRAAAMARRGLDADPTDRSGMCRTALAAIYLNNVHTPVESGMLTAAWLESNPTSIPNRLWAESFRTFHLCSYNPTSNPRVHADNVTAIARETGSPTAIALSYWASGQVAAIEDRQAAIDLWKLGLDWTRSLPGNQLLEHLLLGLILHFKVRIGDLRDVLTLCRSSLEEAMHQHYVAGASHLFGVTAIALCRAGDPTSGARLVGAMVANGHHPRRNAVRALEEALGDKLDHHLAAGRPLTTHGAAVVAVEALNQAIADLE